MVKHFTENRAPVSHLLLGGLGQYPRNGPHEGECPPATLVWPVVAHSREVLFSKALPQETRKWHHFFDPSFSDA
jgi:hypothetical protein